MVVADHPKLGNVEGVEKEGVFAFYGLKYASLAHAFATPEICTPKAGSVHATKYGPTAISSNEGCDLELSLIQQNLPHGDFHSSPTDCLNLNIVLPRHNNGKLPVFVYLHGGGFSIGSNAWPQYDLARIVAQSQEIGQPVIGVQINYRLGIYGLLDSEALRSAGVVPNRSLLDQRAAFEWVQDHIAGFGGDPQRITGIGESAGGISLTMHLQSSRPLFKQMVSMGGTAILMKPLPPFVAERTYGDVLQKLGIHASLQPFEQLQQLVETPLEKVLTRIGPDVPLLPVIDSSLLLSPQSFSTWSSRDRKEKIPGMQWCSRIMLGDCQYDGSILGLALSSRSADIAMAFHRSISKNLEGHSEDIETILNGYRITPTVSDDEAVKGILRFITDIHFYAPIIEIARSCSFPSFVYHFNERNPWDGPNKGEANHILDVAYLFQNFTAHLNDQQNRVSKQFANDIITFVNGADPYPTYDAASGGAQVYGPPVENGTQFVQSDDPSKYGRRDLIWRLASRVGLDKLSLATDMFMAGT